MEITDSETEQAVAASLRIAEENGLGAGAKVISRADNFAAIARERGNLELAERLREYGSALVVVCDGEIELVEI